jgi:phage terminase large subunit
MWFEFRKIIDESHITPTDRLKKELTTRKYKVDKYGRYQVESKDNYKKRGYRSPDHADSFLLAHLKVVDKIHYGFV